MKILKKSHCLLFIVASIATNAHSEVKYVKECIGHYKYDLPDSSYPGLLPVSILEGRIDANYARFPNGEKVFPRYENQLQYQTYWFVFEAKDKNDSIKYSEKKLERFKQKKKEQLASSLDFEREEGKGYHYKRVDDTLYLMNKKAYNAMFFWGNYGYFFGGEFNNFTINNNDIKMQSNRALIAPRRLNEIPQNGLCIPMATLKETDMKDLDLTANYQLLDYPEVTFSLQESVTTNQDYQEKPNRDWIDMRLITVANHHSENTKIHLIGSPRYRSRSLGDKQGLEVLSQYISRESKKPVYLYIARMIADKPGDSSLTFLAYLDESNAKNNPLPVEEFEKIMTRIVDSIERRK
ncbi:hypothetical protein EKN56_07360 [Limnobaculum zhutongyuii]|uniref:Tle cognate immunity protein 4 C-terminal domain-containing protein n=1 Tax=Limnobaculum zhutongyuii TaxID=2498113 RepID=A0A411WJ69_9GAMM|nr:hypothetical protein [Limnobaculum zhutongyuii]QBH96234.1 hypothetical protein EKN56_07360 [Limnobaculum zhutongyuii]TQS87178.1 hypothetical protein ELQ32_15900 [Limnobaculum zhutongyuii]